MHPGTRSRSAIGPALFRPPRLAGVGVGIALTLWALLFAALAIRAVAGAPAEFKTFLGWAVAATLVVTAFTLANWTHGVWSLAYIIDADTLTVRWGFRRVVIPLGTVLRMVPGRTLDTPHIHGLNWWGCHIGHADVKRIGYTLFYSTHTSPDELLYIHTTEESYALTVLDQAQFAEEIQARAGLAAAVASRPQRSAATGIAAFPFWRDRIALGASGISVLMCVVLCGFVFGRYPGLPDVVQLNFPALGGIVRVGDKQELLKIAYAGLGVLGLNLLAGAIVHSRERAAGLWLLASGGMAQAVLLAAAVVAFERA